MKNGYKLSNDKPVFRMVSSQRPENSRRYSGRVRDDAMTMPAEIEGEEPLLNQMSTSITPEEIETLYEEEFPDTERLVVYHGRQLLNNRAPETYIENSDIVAPINPPEVARIFEDKRKTHEHLHENEIPVIPSETASILFQEGKTDYEAEREAEKAIGDIKHDYGDGPVGGILKAYGGSRGEGIFHFEDWEEAKNYLNLAMDRQEVMEGVGIDGSHPNPREYVQDHYLLQPVIFHWADTRTELYGDEVGNAFRRIAPDGSNKTNLSGISSLVGTKELSIYGKGINALRQGRAQACDVGFSNSEPLIDSESVFDLSPEKRALTHAAGNSFDPQTHVYNEDLPEDPFKFALDILEADIERLEHLPDEYRPPIMKYAEPDKGVANIIAEGNVLAGSIGGWLAREGGTPEQLPPMQMKRLVDELAEIESQDLSQIAENPENSFWRRTDSYFPALEAADQDNQEIPEEFFEDARKNVKNYQNGKHVLNIG